MKAAFLLITSAWMASSTHQAPATKAPAIWAVKAPLAKAAPRWRFPVVAEGQAERYRRHFGGGKGAACGKGAGDSAAKAPGMKGCGNLDLLGGLRNRLSGLGCAAKNSLHGLKDRLAGLAAAGPKARAVARALALV